MQMFNRNIAVLTLAASMWIAVFGAASAMPLSPGGSRLGSLFERFALIEPIQCRVIYRSVPYCTQTRYRGRVCGRRSVAQTVCGSRSRLRRVCYRTAYRGTLCEWRRSYY